MTVSLNIGAVTRLLLPFLLPRALHRSQHQYTYTLMLVVSKVFFNKGFVEMHCTLCIVHCEFRYEYFNHYYFYNDAERTFTIET